MLTMNHQQAATADNFTKAVSSIVNSLAMVKPGRKPLLYGPDNKPVTFSNYIYSRTAAKRTGSLKNWIPRRLVGNQMAARQRIDIVERAIDLTNNDPNASGIVDGFSTTVIGSGLIPHPTLSPEALDMDKEAVRQIQTQEKIAYNTWAPFADAGNRMSFGEIQFLIMRSLLRFGEYLVLLPMVKDTTRPYSLACQVIHPLRLKTPLDQIQNGNIKDGVEIGKYGEPLAYWIKKSTASAYGIRLPDVTANFMHIRVKQAHRWKVLHGFISNDPEQVRGVSFFAPAMKFFRDLNDFLDAELVTNIVTAAMGVWIEINQGENPYEIADAMASRTETRTNPDNESEDTRYQEMIPGQIMYGNAGEKPHLLAANRPGTTFEPFTKTIKKAIAISWNIPYPVLFKDVEKVNFAGFRSAMLDAWRVFSFHRTLIGQGFCQKIFTMLQEEAFLRGHLKIDDFYGQMWNLTKTEWRGTPKGDIEPIKAVQADVLAVQNNIKTRAEAIAERGGDHTATFNQLEEEQEALKKRNLTETPLTPEDADKAVENENKTGDNDNAD